MRWIYCMEEVAELTEIEDLESEEFYGFIRRHLVCLYQNINNYRYFLNIFNSDLRSFLHVPLHAELFNN